MSDFTRDDVLRYLLGELSPDSRIYAVIHDDFVKNPNGAVARILQRFSEEAIEAADHHLDRIWTILMAGSEAASDEGGDDSSKLLAAPPEPDFETYWNMDDYDLTVELSQYEDEHLVRTSGHPLEAYRTVISKFLSQHWDWKQKRNLPEFKDPRHTAAALAQALQGEALDLPFPADLVATILVKSGLDSWCE